MKKYLAGLACALGVIAVGAGSTAAQASDLVVPVDTVLTGQSLGDEVLVASAAVPSELVGQTCDVQAIAVNQASIHPDNDLLIRTGSSSVVIPDVERAPNSVTPASGSVVLGTGVDVYVRMGPSTVFSAGMDVHFDCTAPTPTTQPASTPPPTTATPTTQPTSVSTTASSTPATQPGAPTTAGRSSAGGSGSLPVTGDGSTRIAIVSLLLLAGGVALVALSRRRAA